MSESAKAVFLSYASQDVAAALRICAALRAAGVEVWFDKNELVGGDAWDQKIRRQIKECMLFVPVISAATQARTEGYFRLEWRLADQRTHLMAKGRAFLLPVVIDDTRDADAHVPDSFTEVQWTRLPGGEASGAFAARVITLLGGEAEVEPGRSRLGARGEGAASPTKPSRREGSPPWLTAVIVVVPILVGLAIAWRTLPRSGGTSAENKFTASAPTPPPAPAPVSPAAPAPSPAVELANRARDLYNKVGFGRDDLALADDFAKRATDTDPTSAFCWGVRAHVQAAYLFRGFAVGDELVQRSRDAQSFANRALALDASEVEALLAQGRVAASQRAYAQAEEMFGRALAAHPDDNRIRRALGAMLRNQPKRVAEALGVLQEAVRRDPRDPLAHYDLAVTWSPAWNFSAAWDEYETVLRLQPFGGAFTGKASLALKWKGDVTPLRAALERLAPADRAEDRAVYYAMLCGVLERDPDATSTAAALTPRDYLEDSAVVGPKAWFPALAYQRTGKENLARAQWQAAEAVLRERIRTDPRSERYRIQLALTLAWLGRTDDAARELAPIEAAWREQMIPTAARELARHYAALGESAKALAYLRQAVNQTWLFTDQDMRLDPFLDKVRDTPEFVALLAAPPKQPAPVVPVPYLGKGAATATPASREAEQIVAGVFATLATVNYTKENLAVAEDLTRKATDLAPDSARAWAARARVQAAYIQRTWDAAAKRRQDTETFAIRALTLDPDEADAMIARSMVTGTAQSEPLLRRALELRPADPLIRRLLGGSLLGQRRNDEGKAMRLETVRLFPDDALAHYDLGLFYLNNAKDADRALASFDAALAIEPFASAILNKVMIMAGAKGDLAAARRALATIPATDRSEDRAMGFAMWLGLLEGNGARVAAAANLSARTYIDDLSYFTGPKAWMLAHMFRRDGKETFARLQWEAAETVARVRLQAKPDGLQEKLELGVTLAWLGRTREIPDLVATIEGVARESGNWAVYLAAAQYYAGLGDAAKAVPFLRKALNDRNTLSDRTVALDPWWDKLHGTPEFEALLAEAQARIEQEKK